MMRSMHRRDFLRYVAATGAGAAAARFASAADEPAADRPNIIYIMSDDHASHAITAYGSRINKTPQIDRLAKDGMRLDNCFCTNSICEPSRAVLLTGKYSHKNGVYTNGARFDGSQQTFPKLLRKAGYQTMMIGKWHLKTEPTGFDYWNVLPGQGAYHDPVMIEMGERKKLKGYVTDLITDITIDRIKKRDKAKPFCLLCHHKAPHRRWHPDVKHADMYKDIKIPEPETFNDDYSNRSKAASSTTMTIEHHLTRRDVKADPPEGVEGQALKEWKYQRYIKDYLRCIASVDDNIGRLLDFLEKEGLAENTIVIYTSDQGFYLGDHGWFDKRFIYEESLRMPFLVRYPKEIKPRSVNTDIVVNIDFAPTFLDYAGAPIPDDMQGRSLRKLLKGDTPADWRDSMYYHYYEYPAVHSVKRHYGLRTKRYKMVHFYHDIDAWELFDLKKDPNELNSVYDDPDYADVRKKLHAELERLRKQYGDTVKSAEGLDRQRYGPPATGLQMHLKMDDRPGAGRISDASGNKRNLKCVGTKIVEGRNGKCRKFNGGGDHLDLDRQHCPEPRYTPVAALAWIKPDKADGVIVAQGGESWGYSLYLKNGRPAFATTVADRRTTIVGEDKLPGGWVHLTGCVAKGGKMSLFVNGKSVARGKASGVLANNPHDNLQVGADRGSLVGDYGSNNFYGGLIDDLKLIYGKLDASQIAKEARR